MSYGVYDESGNKLLGLSTPLILRSNQPVYASDSLSLKRSVAKRPVQRWEISCEGVKFNGGERYFFTELMAKGFTQAYKLTFPQLNPARPIFTESTHNVGNTAIAGASTLSISGTIEQGSFVRFGNHTKIYVILNDITNGGIAQIYPPLIQEVPSGTTMYYEQKTFGYFYLNTDSIQGITYEDGMLCNFGKLNFLEKV